MKLRPIIAVCVTVLLLACNLLSAARDRPTPSAAPTLPELALPTAPPTFGASPTETLPFATATAAPIMAPAPDAGLLLYWKMLPNYGGYELYVYDPPTRRSRYVLSSRYPAADLSPDGTTLLFGQYDDAHGAGDLFAFDLSGARLTRLTNTPGRNESSPRWLSGLPGMIAFSLYDEQYGGDGECGGVPALLELSTGKLQIFDLQSCEPPALSPDGKTLLLSAAWDTRSPYQVIDGRLQPYDLRRFGYSPAPGWKIGAPVWSPNGATLAMLAGDDAHAELWLFDVNAGNHSSVDLPLNNGGHGGWFFPPAWSPDGRWIITQDPSYNMIAVDNLEMRYFPELYGPVVWQPDSRAFFAGVHYFALQGRLWAEQPSPLPDADNILAWLPPGAAVHLEALPAAPPTASVPTPTLRPPMPDLTATPSVQVSINGVFYVAWEACPNLFPSLLHAGDQAMVSAVPPRPNRVRKQPGLDAPALGLIAPGERLTVIAGPRCSDGLIWWQIVAAKGITGWTAEGDGNDYWLLPLLP